jgi:hypothetical protein
MNRLKQPNKPVNLLIPIKYGVRGFKGARVQGNPKKVGPMTILTFEK